LSEKLEALGFDFMSAADIWGFSYEKAKEALASKFDISEEAIGRENNQWLAAQYKLLTDGKLTRDQAQKIKALSLDYFYMDWTEQIEQTGQFYEDSHPRNPTLYIGSG